MGKCKRIADHVSEQLARLRKVYEVSERVPPTLTGFFHEVASGTIHSEILPSGLSMAVHAVGVIQGIAYALGEDADALIALAHGGGSDA